MAKKKVGGGKRYKAAVEAKATGDKPAWTGPAPPKHLQRKIARKVGFLDKVAASQPAGLRVKSRVEKRTARTKKPSASAALDNFGSLSGVLDEVQRAAAQKADEKRQAGGHAFGEAVRSSKTRLTIQATETARLQQVLKHPVFKADPIAAITNHLKATVPETPPKSEKSQQQGQRSRKDKKKQAQKRKKQAADMME